MGMDETVSFQVERDELLEKMVKNYIGIDD